MEKGGDRGGQADEREREIRRVVTSLCLSTREERIVRAASTLLGIEQLGTYARFAVLLAAGDRELAARSVPAVAYARAPRLSHLRHLLIGGR